MSADTGYARCVQADGGDFKRVCVAPAIRNVERVVPGEGWSGLEFVLRNQVTRHGTASAAQYR